MTIVFTCPCGRTLQVAEAIPGRKARCPGCGRRSAIPVADAPSPIRPSRRFVLVGVLAAIILGVSAGATVLGLIASGLTNSATPTDQVALVKPSEPLPPQEKPPGESGVRVQPEGSPGPGDSMDKGQSVPETASPNQTALPDAAPEQSPNQLVAVPERKSAAKQEEPGRRLAGAPEKPSVPQRALDPPKENKPGLVWSLPPQLEFWQEVQVSQNSAFRMPSLESPMTTSARYVIVSRMTVAKTEPDGSATIHQRIEAARLEEGDEVTRSVLAPVVRDLVGRTYTLTLNPQREVVRIEGQFSPPRTASLGGIGFVQAGLIDRDGWKELHQATFFQPNRVVRPGDHWTRETTHSWGALGDWTGKTHYLYAGGRGPQHRVDYRFELVHSPSNGTGRTSPLPIAQAGFRHQPSGGTIWFDAERGRVVAVEERFHVRGRISLSILGQNLPVEMEEVQAFRVSIHDREPVAR